MEKITVFICGFALVIIGAALYESLNRSKGGKGLTDFQGFLLGTGFAYIAVIVWEQIKFFCDYYIKRSATQGYNLIPDKKTLFFMIFGSGVAGEAQYPVLNTDLNFLSAVTGAALGGAALLIYRSVENKRRAADENGLLCGYEFKKTPPRLYIKNEVGTLRRQISLSEYLFWWLLRGMMLFLMLKKLKTDGFDYVVLQFAVNLAVTFIIPVVRLLFFGKLFFGKISFRVQTYIDIFVLFGTLLGHGYDFYGLIDNYDKYLHFVSGSIAVFIGLTILEGTRNAKDLTKTVKTLAGMGFSCTVMVVWEIFEFFADFYMEGMQNQNWNYSPAGNMLFYRLFGYGAGNAGQLGVLDTDMDIFFALTGCILSGAAVYAFLSLKERSAEKEYKLELRNSAHRL